jgi:DNA replicative helicase MCM subunit Mcm2 (Cdc46/Mcm family)
MSQVKVEVQHHVLRCDNCGMTVDVDNGNRGDDCFICERSGGSGSLHPYVIKAEVLVDEDNMENVRDDPAFMRVV